MYSVIYQFFSPNKRESKVTNWYTGVGVEDNQSELQDCLKNTDVWM